MFNSQPHCFYKDRQQPNAQNTFFYLQMWEDFKTSRGGKDKTTNINPLTIREKLTKRQKKKKQKYNKNTLTP